MAGRSRRAVIWAFAAAMLTVLAASASELTLRDGRILWGKRGLVSSIGEASKNAMNPAETPLGIVLLDDDLRRTFIGRSQVVDVKEEESREVKERFVIRQPSATTARAVKSVGPTLSLTAFDEFGRRTLTMGTIQGKVEIVQAITEITPEWTKVESLRYQWDMRIATSSIPRDVLGKILYRQINPKEIEHRKRIARFYIQCERYEDAQKEIESILKDFGNDPSVKEQLTPPLQAVRRLSATRLLNELKARRDAGQHALVRALLEKFPTEGATGDTLQAVREMLDAYQAMQKRRELILVKFDEMLAKVTDPSMLAQVRPIREEIARELNPNTLGRMAAFLQHVGDEDLSASDRLALGISGWLLGGDASVTKLPVAVSAYRVRTAILAYMNEPVQLKRTAAITNMDSEEAATPNLVAQIIANMKPPRITPDTDSKKPGFYELEVPGQSKEPAVRYLVQLPPEYDPLRKYPTIVSLHGLLTTPEQQVDWWAGEWTAAGFRSGQASRRGYIVIAPAWTIEHQKDYLYSAREHAAVLDCLRDACRRFSVDTDRVYLSGHSIGGDAAWDLGLAHPDLWAGVIPISAKIERYGSFYWENAKMVPYYFIAGELDGNRMAQNAREFDRYFLHRYSLTVVEFLGRGNEDFYDEIQRLFDWMGRYQRNFYPKEFAVKTMRPWDNFFWWVETSGMPSASMVDPASWPPPRGCQPFKIEASLKAGNNIYVQGSASQVTVWLSTKLFEGNKKPTIAINGRRIPAAEVQPRLATLLEDVRTRGDRQHPFWARVEFASTRTKP